jgi:hypothetical protein
MTIAGREIQEGQSFAADLDEFRTMQVRLRK